MASIAGGRRLAPAARVAPGRPALELTESEARRVFTSTACSGTGPTNLGTDYGVTIPPRQSRTVSLTLSIAADSGCNGNIGFYSYFYAEFSDSTNTSGRPVHTPETRVLCT